PKISTDLQIDWRRKNSGADADMFTDLLADQMKRRAGEGFPEPKSRAKERSASGGSSQEALSGRPARVAIAHPKTLRGEAKEVKETSDRKLAKPSPDQADCKSDGVAETAGDSAP